MGLISSVFQESSAAEPSERCANNPSTECMPVAENATPGSSKEGEEGPSAEAQNEAAKGDGLAAHVIT